jgi:hypothetical protein
VNGVSTTLSCPNRMLMSRSVLMAALLTLTVLGLISVLGCGDASADPVLEVTSPPGYTFTNASVQRVEGITEPSIQVTATLNHSMYRQHPEDAPRNSTVSGLDGRFSMTIELREGVQYIDVMATDGEGNTTLVKVSIVLDTTPPDVEVVSPVEDLTYTNNTTWEFVAVSLCDCDWDDYFLNDLRFEVVSMGVHNITVPLDEGVNDFVIRVLDDVGNEFRKDVTIVRDTLVPALNVTNAPTTYTNRNVLHICGTVQGASGPVGIMREGLVYKASLTSGSWSEGAEWYADLSLGGENRRYNVTVSAVDLAGNEAREVLTVHYDDQPPYLQFHEYPTYTNKHVVHINASTSSDICAGSINDSLLIFEGGVFSEDVGLREGWNNLTVIVRDRAGNEAQGELSIFLDTVAPSLDLEVPDRSYGRTVRLKGSTSETDGQVLVDGVSYPVVDGRFDIELELRSGRNQFTVSITDAAGNATEREVSIDHVSLWPWLTLALLCLMVVTLAWMVRIRREGRA